MDCWAFLIPGTIFPMLPLKNANNVDFAVLFDVDFSIMGEFEGQAAFTESWAIWTATETYLLVAVAAAWLWVS